jgi:hypothetical protein
MTFLRRGVVPRTRVTNENGPRFAGRSMAK